MNGLANSIICGQHGGSKRLVGGPLSRKAAASDWSISSAAMAAAHNAQMRILVGFRRALSALVATALVTAQLAGFAHRIDHPAVTLDASPLVWHVPKSQGEHARFGNDHSRVNLVALWRHLVPGNHADNQDGDLRATHQCLTYDDASLGSGPPLAIAHVAAEPCMADVPGARGRDASTGVIAIGYLSRAPPVS
jgi:hypothetical protein